MKAAVAAGFAGFAAGPGRRMAAADGPRLETFTDWIRAINAAKAKLSPKDYVASINDGFAEAQRFGTTTIANLTAFPELIPPIREPIRTWWFAELIDVRDPNRANEIVDLAVGSLKSKQNWGLAPHAPFTVSANLYRRCEEIAERENVLLTTHLAESREEMQMFRDATGSLYDFLKELGRDMSDCGGKTPLEEFVGRAEGASLPYWIIVHLNELTKNDFDLLAGSIGKFSIVHCPRSHGYFGHSPFHFEKLKNLGLNICLGTDSLASNDDLSLFAEMRAFQKEFPQVSSEEILKMVTIHAARALRQENSLGKIRCDFAADLIAMPCTRHGQSVQRRTTSTSMFDEVVAFDQPVDWLMIGGAIQVPA